MTACTSACGALCTKLSADVELWACLKEHVVGEAHKAGVSGLWKPRKADLLAHACLVHLEQHVWTAVRQQI